LLLFALASVQARADTLVLPPVLERAGTASAVWRLDAPAPAAGQLELRWTDSAGRLVERQVIAVAEGAPQVTATLDLRRAVTMQNTLAGRLLLPGATRDAAASFLARPPPSGWTDYEAIMWQPGTAARAAGLRALGFSAGKVTADRAGDDAAGTAQSIAPLLANDLRWYVENSATDFYAPYHRWFADRPVTWLFDETRRLHRADPSAIAGFTRTPSLSDPAWLERIRRRLAELVRVHGPYRPLFYNLADEAGIADLAAFWDFDLSAESLAGFRGWLAGEYGDIAALNRQWGTDFATWEQATPLLTDAALSRGDDNFSAWSDFKAWMDVAFARAVRAGTEAVHAADPTALAGLEGTQPPGWGGYDYTLLAGAVDVMESYNGGDSIEIARAFNPALAVLTTCFGQGPQEARQIWRQLLLGSRGLIVWDEAGDVVGADGTPGPRGRFFAPLLRELRGGIAAQLLAATPVTDKVAVLVSPPSFRVNWLLDRRADGVAWQARGSEAEYDSGTADRRSLPRVVQLLTGLGVRPLFVSPATLAQGDLRTADMRVLILPQSIALSDAEAAAIRDFSAAGGLVLADGEPGLFDGHGRRRASPALAGLAVRHPPVLAEAPAAADPAPLEAMASLLREGGIVPGFSLAGARGRPAPDVEARAWRDGEVTLLALLANGAATPVTLTLPRPWLRDLRQDGAAVRTDTLALSLPADGPVLLALSASPLATPVLALAATARPGDLLAVRLGLSGPTPATTHVLHLELRDPQGRPADRLATNLPVDAAGTTWLLPLAADAAPGRWTVRASDRLGGGVAEATVDVTP
jgi:hypothetical protein